METSTPEAELDNELLQLIRSFFSVLHVQFFIGNGAGERAFTLLLRTAENFERWIWSKTRVVGETIHHHLSGNTTHTIIFYSLHGV